MLPSKGFTYVTYLIFKNKSHEYAQLIPSVDEDNLNGGVGKQQFIAGHLCHGG